MTQRGSGTVANDKSKYGGRGRPWHLDFIKYMEFIVEHPAYAGMPDVYYEPGRIQWEAPSNRTTGQFKDTHGLRLKWWAQKAESLGISTSSAKWISRVAKRIHPTRRKPCKICGRELELRYVYPQERFLKRVRALFLINSDFELPALEPITELVSRLVNRYGGQALAALPTLLAGPQVKFPSPLPTELSGWLKWLDEEYIPSEPRVLSPGAMSNAPDRFDGFHSDNLCCRGTADKGRNKTNLKSYVTDRRVFEYWTAGDWVAADRLMGRLRAEYPEEQCRHGHPGPCAVDHIGPISLGFTHRPHFQLLCGSCNSAKNNRMYRSDVDLLLANERAGDEVVSWHTKALWDACKGRVANDEHARRLSKLMRDNRHSLMHALQKVAELGAYTFLALLLELERADQDVEFINLRIENHLTVFDRIERTPRTTKYAEQQKVRRCRVAFQELKTYFAKLNRNSFVVRTPASDKLLEDALQTLAQDAAATQALDAALKQATTDAAFRSLLPQLAHARRASFVKARSLLTRHMDLIGLELATRWEHERYVRELEDDEETAQES